MLLWIWVIIIALGKDYGKANKICDRVEMWVEEGWAWIDSLI